MSSTDGNIEALKGEIEALRRELNAAKTEIDPLIDEMNAGFSLHEMIYNNEGKPVDYRFLRVNRAFENMTGLRAADIINKTVLEILPNTEKYWIDFYGQVSLTGKPDRFENYSSALDRFYEVKAYSPKKNLFAVTIIEITQQKKYEKYISEQRHFMERVIDSAPNCIYIFDISTNRNVYISKAVEKILGYTAEQVQALGPNLFQKLMHPNDLARALEHHRHLSESIDDEIHELEYRFLHSDGQYRVLRSYDTVFARNENKQVTQIAGTIIDHTEKSKMDQELLLSKERAEESDRLKSAFLANMSHEIRTPMNAILGFSQLLDDPNISPEDRHKFIELINKRGHDLLTIINDILDISKIEANQLCLTEGIINVNPLLEEIHSVFLTSKLLSSQVTLEIGKKLPNSNQTYLGDRERLTQILNNLVSNALKFTKSGHIEFGCYTYLDQLNFYVKDTGLGIAESKQALIFHRFHQLEENQFTRQFEGTGLGLSIVKGLTEVMGGSISIESKPGEGSLFNVLLPLKAIDYHHPKLQNQKTSVLKWESCSILVVEDDEYNAIYLKEVLRRYVNSITVATCAHEALQYLEFLKFDLIFMDIRLPDMDGYQLTQKIHEKFPRLPIIAQTAYAKEEDRRNSQEAGCVGFLAKPIGINSILEILTRHVQSSSFC